MRFYPEEKARILHEYIGTESDTATLRRENHVLRRDPPIRADILRWHENFMSNRNFGHTGGNRRPLVSEKGIGEVRLMFSDDPSLSIRSASTSLNVPVTTMHQVLRKCLHLFPNRLQNLHLMRRSDREYRLIFLITANSILTAIWNSFEETYSLMNACFV